jgi:hypothetical protein
MSYFDLGASASSVVATQKVAPIIRTVVVPVVMQPANKPVSAIVNRQQVPIQPIYIQAPIPVHVAPAYVPPAAYVPPVYIPPVYTPPSGNGGNGGSNGNGGNGGGGGNGDSDSGYIATDEPMVEDADIEQADIEQAMVIPDTVTPDPTMYAQLSEPKKTNYIGIVIALAIAAALIIYFKNRGSSGDR